MLVLHGHQLDGLVHFNRLLERVGSRMYDCILDFNLHYNRFRRKLGFGYWSVASHLKLQAKTAVKYVTRFEEGMCRLAATSQVDGVICGHIHRAEMRVVQGVTYMNCGDWVESCTALAEHFDGSFELIRYHENGGLGSSRLSVPAHPAAVVSGAVAAEDLGSRDSGINSTQRPELAGLL
jgi:UDP-2,3-diacylglucosamine pyrophosphatase LpxH